MERERGKKKKKTTSSGLFPTQSVTPEFKGRPEFKFFNRRREEAPGRERERKRNKINSVICREWEVKKKVYKNNKGERKRNKCERERIRM